METKSLLKLRSTRGTRFGLVMFIYFLTLVDFSVKANERIIGETYTYTRDNTSFIVVFNENVDEEQKVHLVRSYNIAISNQDSRNIFRIISSQYGDNIIPLIEEFANKSEVKYASPVYYQDDTGFPYRLSFDNKLIVRIENNLGGSPTFNNLLAQYGLSMIETINIGRYEFQVLAISYKSHRSVLEISEFFNQDYRVDYAEPNWFPIEGNADDFIPNDPYFASDMNGDDFPDQH